MRFPILDCRSFSEQFDINFEIKYQFQQDLGKYQKQISPVRVYSIYGWYQSMPIQVINYVFVNNSGMGDLSNKLQHMVHTFGNLTILRSFPYKQLLISI